MPKELRADLHEAFADWLEREARSAGELDEFVGYHLEQAYRYREELGPVDDAGSAIAARAGGHLLAAGERASGRGDAAAAERLLGRAMALLPAGDPAGPLGHAVDGSGALPTRSARSHAGLPRGGILRANAAGAETIGARIAVHRALVRTHLDPEFSMRSALTEVEDLVASLEAADDELGLAEGWSTWRGPPILARRRCGIPGGQRARACLRRARRIGAAHPAHLHRADRPLHLGTRPDPRSGQTSGRAARGDGEDDSFELNGSLAVAHAMRGEIGPRRRAFRSIADAGTRTRGTIAPRGGSPASRGGTRARSIRRDRASRARRHRATPCDRRARDTSRRR